MLIVKDHSIVTFAAETGDELAWLASNTEAEAWQWQGESLHVDARYAEDVFAGVRDAGFTWEVV